jgi:hypothetical protein
MAPLESILRLTFVIVSTSTTIGGAFSHYVGSGGKAMSRIVRRSEIPSPAIRYLTLKFPAGEHLLTRRVDLLSDPAKIPAEF